MKYEDLFTVNEKRLINCVTPQSFDEIGNNDPHILAIVNTDRVEVYKKWDIYTNISEFEACQLLIKDRLYRSNFTNLDNEFKTIFGNEVNLETLKKHNIICNYIISEDNDYKHGLRMLVRRVRLEEEQ